MASGNVCLSEETGAQDGFRQAEDHHSASAARRFCGSVKRRGQQTTRGTSLRISVPLPSGSEADDFCDDSSCGLDETSDKTVLPRRTSISCSWREASPSHHG